MAMTSEDPPKDAPKWRGDAQEFFKTGRLDPRYTIAQRAKHIAWSFEIPNPKARRSYCSSDDDDEVEDKDKDKDEDEDEDEHEFRYLIEWLIGMLDELQAYDSESIDVASVLHSYDYLSTFIQDVLSNKRACIRTKAAELITTMVKNHPTSQQLLIDVYGIQLLLRNFVSYPDDATLRTKTVGAIYSLIRNNKSGIDVFLREECYEALKNALNSGAGSSTHNELLNLIGYLRRENSSLNLKFEVQEAIEGGSSSSSKRMKKLH